MIVYSGCCSTYCPLQPLAEKPAGYAENRNCENRSIRAGLVSLSRESEENESSSLI